MVEDSPSDDESSIEANRESADPTGEEVESAFWESYGRRASDSDDDAFGLSYGRRVTGGTDRSVGGGEINTIQAIENLTWSDLRAHYGPLRTLFKQYEAQYTTFQRKLDQAKISQTYDVYLTRLVARMVAIVVSAILLGIGAAALIATGWRHPLIASTGLSEAVLTTVVLGAFTLLGTVVAGLYWLWRRVFRIRSLINRRRRNINYNLPYAVTFMYALARAGVDFDQIIARLADSTATYGGAAEEFDRVVRETQMFGNNLYVGLDNLRSITQSQELSRLVDDIIVILETGGDLPGFLRDEIDVQLQTAVDEQESFIEQLELLSEVFVVGLVAAPLFVLVVLMVLAFLGEETLLATTAIVYLVVPLSLALFVLLIDIVSDPFREEPVSFSVRDERLTPPDTVDEDHWQATYLKNKRRQSVARKVKNNITRVGDDPWRALLFSAPIALAIPVLGYVYGVIPRTLPELLEAPLLGTTQLVVAPVLLAFAPVAVVYEYRLRQEAALRERFPVVIGLLETSNRRGLSLARGLDIVTESATGRLATELQRLRNDIRWNADLPGAFESFGNRLTSPSLTRTLSLIAEGSRVTSDLHLVLGVAATDLNERLSLRRKRVQSLQSYLAIVVIGFLVYLLVVLLLTENFLAPIETLSETALQSDDGPVSLSTIPVAELQLILFHSALIQGFGSGLLAGKLAEGNLYGGLKYGLGLTLLTVVVFEGVTFL